MELESKPGEELYAMIFPREYQEKLTQGKTNLATAFTVEYCDYGSFDAIRKYEHLFKIYANCCRVLTDNRLDEAIPMFRSGLRHSLSEELTSMQNEHPGWKLWRERDKILPVFDELLMREAMGKNKIA